MKKLLIEWIHDLFDINCLGRVVLFRVDAGSIPGLSFGHLSRCLILSRALNDLYRCRPVFVMRNYKEGTEYAINAGQEVVILPAGLEMREEWEKMGEIAERYNPGWVVVDLPYTDMDSSFVSSFKEIGAKILFIDDSRFINPDVDVILNSSILAARRTEQNNSNTRYLLGNEYFIFDDSKLASSPIRKEGAFNILMTFGGSDPTGLTLKALHVLLQLDWPDAFFRVILGPGYTHISHVQELIRYRRDAGSVEVNPPDLVPFFLGCDLAVCNGGRTMYELHHMGKVFLPVSSAAHEKEAILEFCNNGLIRFGMTVWDPDDFRKKLIRLRYNS